MDGKRVLFDLYYVVVMHRWGAREGHHYIGGVFNDLVKAKEVAEQLREDRAGKYEYTIEAYPLNKDYRVKGIHIVDKSPEMGDMNDKERKEALGFDNLEATKKFSEYYEKQSHAQLKEKYAQLHNRVEELEFKIEELNDGRKKV